MGIRKPYRTKSHPLIVGITGKQGVDAPETSGQWELFCSLESYGQKYNSPAPYHTVWGAFAGAGAAFATADINPSEPWYIGAVLIKNRKATIERVVFSPRDGTNAAIVTSGAIEVATERADQLTWIEVARFDTKSGVIDINFPPISCIAVRIKANPLYNSTATHPGYTGIQFLGLL